MHKLNHYLILILFSLLILIPGMTSLPVIDRDEAHFAQASRQMIQNNNYFQIRFQDKTRFQKPPGINWLQAASVNIFSNEDSNAIWPYRLPSILAALFSILLSYFFARRFLNPKTAFFGALFLASALLLVFEAHMAVIDSALLFSVVLMQGSLWIIYEDKKSHWGWALCFWLSLAFGLVLKGVTPLVAVLSILALCLIDRDISFLKRLHPIKGLLLFFILTLIWVFKVNAAENSNYLMQMIHKDLLPKLQGGHESHGKPPLFHLAILPLTFWPASLFLWQTGAYSFTNRKQKKIRFLLAWLVPTWIFFEIMPTKLPQYVLPTFPALAMLMSLSLEHLRSKPGKWLHFLQILWALLSLSLGVLVAGLFYFLMHYWSFDSILLMLIITVMTVISLYYAWRAEYNKASIILLLMAVLSYPLIFSRILPKLTPIWLTKNIVEKINLNNISETKPLLVVGFEEPSLVFNFNTRLVKFSSLSDAIADMNEDKSRIILLPENMFKDSALSFHIESETLGFNYSKGKWVKLLIIRQDERDK